MILREDLLSPIAGDNPSGVNLRYAPEYDQIKEARRQDDGLPQGVWVTERKLADYRRVIDLAQEALATKGKDLQFAAWLTEALLKHEGFSGLQQGLKLCHGLLDKFWDNVYPLGSDGDWEARAEPIEWIGNKLPDAVKNVPLTLAGYSWYKFQESRIVGHEKDAQTDTAKKAREKALKDGKLSADAFDKSRDATPKTFYVTTERALDECLNAIGALDRLCEQKFGDSAPSLAALKRAIQEVRSDVHAWLEDKRKTEPDPVEHAPESIAAIAVKSEEAAEPSAPTATISLPAAKTVVPIPLQADSEPADQREAVAATSAAAAFLRKRDPYSPAPYLMMRGFRWGELRAALATSDPRPLEAPATEIRQEIKKLALNGQWKELLEQAENVMSLPCSRGWLDLQRFVIEACAALGEEYNSIVVAIRSELRALLRDFPQLLDARLMDDTAVANAETQVWLRGLIAEPDHTPPDVHSPPVPVSDGHAPGWQKTFVDSSVLAGDALRAGQEQKAFQILFSEVERQRSGRGRFQRKLQLVQLCVAAGKDTIAQPLLEDLTAAIENHKLEDWEDHEFIAGALATILRSSKKVQGDAKEKQKLFERICRLDPVQALSCH